MNYMVSASDPHGPLGSKIHNSRPDPICGCRLDYGFRPVRLPEHPDVPLWLVVVRGLGEKPMMLLTNLSLRKNRKLLWWVTRSPCRS